MGRELVPVQTASVRESQVPSRSELVQLLRRLRLLCAPDALVYKDAMRAYDISRTLGRSGASHRIDLRL